MSIISNKDIEWLARSIVYYYRVQYIRIGGCLGCEGDGSKHCLVEDPSNPRMNVCNGDNSLLYVVNACVTFNMFLER